jgi:hypothetical protein
MMVFS